MDPPEGHYAKVRTTHHRMLLRILGEPGASRRTSASSRTKTPFQRTECESIETTVRTRRLLWVGALLRMGDNRLPKRVMSGELDNAGNVGRRERRKSGRTAWQMIFDYWHHGGLKHRRT